MNATDITEAAMARAERAIERAGPLSTAYLVRIVAEALTTPSPETVVAADALRKWNAEDPVVPRFEITGPDCEYTTIAQLVLDVADDYRRRHPAKNPIPMPPPPFSLLPGWSPMPPPPEPMVASALDVALVNTCAVLNTVRLALISVADREGQIVRRQDAVMVEEKAKECRQAVTALRKLLTTICQADDCLRPPIYETSHCPHHTFT